MVAGARHTAREPTPSGESSIPPPWEPRPQGEMEEGSWEEGEKEEEIEVGKRRSGGEGKGGGVKDLIQSSGLVTVQC